jgi:hypothetical protein
MTTTIKALIGLAFAALGLVLLKVLPPADDQPPVHDPLVAMQPDPTRAPAGRCG